MRDALSLTDQAIAFGSGQLQEAAVRQMLGAVDRSYVFRLIDALAQGDGKTVVETSDTLRLNGLSAASTLEEMSAVLQRMAVYQAVPQMAGAVDADGQPWASALCGAPGFIHSPEADRLDIAAPLAAQVVQEAQQNKSFPLLQFQFPNLELSCAWTILHLSTFLLISGTAVCVLGHTRLNPRATPKSKIPG